MTQAVRTMDELLFGDMNGPIAYWGPVTASPTAGLTATERALLGTLRSQFVQGRTDGRTAALTWLLAAPAAVAVA